MYLMDFCVPDYYSETPGVLIIRDFKSRVAGKDYWE